MTDTQEGHASRKDFNPVTLDAQSGHPRARLGSVLIRRRVRELLKQKHLLDCYQEVSLFMCPVLGLGRLLELKFLPCCL